MSTVQEEKAAIRKEMLALRSKMTDRECRHAGGLAAHTLFSDRTLNFFSRFRFFASYLSVNDEFPTDEIHYHLLANTPCIYVPRYSNSQACYQWSILTQGTMLEPGPLRIPQPPRDAIALSTSDVEVVFVPGVAFDVRGGRIGYGKGVYDRLLRLLRPNTLKVALAFNCQVQRDALPLEDHDIRMDYIITEESWIDCRRARQVRRG